MMSIEVRIPVIAGGPPPEVHPELLRLTAAALGIAAGDLGAVVVRHRALDARKRRAPVWVIKVDASRIDEAPPSTELPPLVRPRKLAKDIGNVRPIIVGMGPAGLFAALAFADAGVRCTVIDRGEGVEGRSLKVRDLRSAGQLDPESNLCFGEGGAGTYSDGKLYTRSKHPRVREVYERLVALGAGRDILIHAHPHVGSNRLIPMMKKLRAALMEAGHSVVFGRRVDDLILDSSGALPRVTGVRLDDGTEMPGGPVVFATGHSARDTYAMLARRGVAMQRKDFAIGARVEHPQALIDAVQLGPLAGDESVGAAEYFLTQRVPSPQLAEGRGVYSFCMCPGGFVLPSPTVRGRLNVNGMSNAGRGSGFANAALVAQVMADEFYFAKPGDLDGDADYGAHVAGGALLGLALQERIEQACFVAGGSDYQAPAQNLLSFVAGRDSAPLPERYTYRPGIRPGRIDQLLPPRIAQALQHGARQVEHSQLRGYLSREAIIVGAETTTSSPVRVVRGADRQSVSHQGLYPCAEGAGYAGGIVSSAIDGLEAAEAILLAAGLVPAQMEEN